MSAIGVIDLPTFFPIDDDVKVTVPVAKMLTPTPLLTSGNTNDEASEVIRSGSFRAAAKHVPTNGSDIISSALGPITNSIENS